MSWTAPAGFWDLCGAVEDKALLSVEEDMIGLSAALLTVHTATQPRVAIERVLHDAAGNGGPMKSELIERGETSAGELRFEWAVVRYLDTNELQSFAYAREGERLLLWLQTAPLDSPAARAAMQSTLAGLRVGAALDPVVDADGRSVDHRHGVALRVPAGFVRSEGAHDLITWTKGDNELGLGALEFPASAAPDWALDWAKRIFETQVEAKGDTTLETQAVEIAGHAGSSLSWSKGQIDVFVDRGWGHMLIYDGLDAEQIQAVRASFELL